MNTQEQIETEAKYIIPNASIFAELQKLTSVGDFKLKSVGTRTFTDLYLDTAQQQILQAGYACRIRKGQDRQLLTLKALSPAEGSMHRRREIETEIQSDTPSNWQDSEAKRLVLEIAGQDSLQTLFVIFQTRHQFHALSDNQPVIEFSLDEVSLQDRDSVDYFELEAELIEAGTEANLSAFIDALQANWSLQPESKSKFERGLALLSTSNKRSPQ